MDWGAVAHVAALVHLIENETNIAEFKVIHPSRPKTYRYDQLKKMGIMERKGDFRTITRYEEDFPSYYRKSLEYVKNHPS